jgi:hypothetical protein
LSVGVLWLAVRRMKRCTKAATSRRSELLSWCHVASPTTAFACLTR